MSQIQTKFIANNAITNAKLAEMATLTIKGNNTGGTTEPLDLSTSQVTAMLDVMVGAEDGVSDGVKGLVPQPLEADELLFLRGDGTWAAPSFTALTVGSIDSQTPSANGLVIDSNVLYAQSASATVPGMVNTTTQSFAGNKTFTGSISASNLSGTNTGDQTITLTGDVTGSGTGSFAATIANSAVTNAKMANMATQTIKGRTTAGSGAPEDLTAAQATAILDVFGPDSGSGGPKGLVPATVSGDATKFLKGDGTWAVPADSGITELTGDVTAGPGSGAQAATISTNVVSNDKLAQVATHTIKGRAASGTGDVEDLTATQATSILDEMDGANGVDPGLKGLVPAPAATDNVKYLKGDGTWDVLTDTTYTAGDGIDIVAEEISVDASSVMFSFVSGQLRGLVPTFNDYPLDSTDITNQAVTLLAGPAQDGSVMAFVDGVMLRPGTDYTVTGDQFEFAGDIATGGPAALVDGDVLYIQYWYKYEL